MFRKSHFNFHLIQLFIILSIFSVLSFPAHTDTKIPLAGRSPKAHFLYGQWDGDRYLVGVEINAGRGTKTYWRNPGDAGISPQFDWEGSVNIGDIEVLWPAPMKLKETFPDSVLTTYGYETRVILPIWITPQKKNIPIQLNLFFEFGLCKEQCIPSDATFRETLSPDRPKNDLSYAALSDILKTVPIKKRLGIAENSLSILKIEEASNPKAPQIKEIHVFAHVPPASGQPELFVDLPKEWSFSDPVLEATKEEGQILFRFTATPNRPIQTSTLKLVLVAGTHATETEIPLSSSEKHQ